MTQEIYIVLFVMAILAIFFIVVFTFQYLEKNEREQIKKISQTLGLSFSGKLPSLEVIKEYPNFKIFKHGNGVQNLIYGQFEGVDIKLFEYSYETSYVLSVTSHTSNTSRQTVMVLKSNDWSLPCFRLSLSDFHFFGNNESIQFDSHPNFSSQYFLIAIFCMQYQEQCLSWDLVEENIFQQFHLRLQSFHLS